MIGESPITGAGSSRSFFSDSELRRLNGHVLFNGDMASAEVRKSFGDFCDISEPLRGGVSLQTRGAMFAWRWRLALIVSIFYERLRREEGDIEG